MSPSHSTNGVQATIAKNVQSTSDAVNLPIYQIRPLVLCQGAPTDLPTIFWSTRYLDDQHQNTYQNPGVNVLSLQTELKASNKVNTDSWAVGSRLGLNTNWNAVAWSSFLGNGSGDLLYTRYNWKGVTTVTGPLDNRASPQYT